MQSTASLSPQIPYDVLIQICEQLGNDKKTLKSLSRTASFYRSPAQRSLFRRIDISSSRYLRGFERTVKSKSTSIGSFVRELVLVGLKPGDPWLEDFVTLGNVLDQVRTVELSIADMLTIMPKLGDWASQHVVGHFPRLGTMKITTPNLLPTSQICDLLSAFPQLKHLHVSAGLLSDDSYPAFTSKFTHNLKSLSLKGYNAKESKDDPLHQLEWIMKHSKNHGLQNVTFDLFDVDMRLCSKVANICVVNPQKTRIILDARSSTAPIFQTGGVSRCNRTIRLCLLDRHCILGTLLKLSYPECVEQIFVEQRYRPGQDDLLRTLDEYLTSRQALFPRLAKVVVLPRCNTQENKKALAESLVGCAERGLLVVTEGVYSGPVIWKKRMM